MNAEAISQSLSLLAERSGDPSDLIYRRLFDARPELERLFVRDVSGQVRGHMLSMVLETLLDLGPEEGFADNMIRAECVNHQGLGVPPEMFMQFFPVIMETAREKAGTDWTIKHQSAWNDLLKRLSS